MPCSSS